MKLGKLGKPIQRGPKLPARRSAGAREPVLIGQLRPVVGVGNPGAAVAQRLELPAPQMTRRSLAYFGWIPRDATGFNEVDNVVLADAVTGQRHAEYLTDAPNPLPRCSFDEIVIAVPQWLLRGVGNQLEDPLRACRDLAGRAHHRGDVGVVGHNAIKDQPRRYGA